MAKAALIDSPLSAWRTTDFRASPELFPISISAQPACVGPPAIRLRSAHFRIAWFVREHSFHVKCASHLLSVKANSVPSHPMVAGRAVTCQPRARHAEALTPVPPSGWCAARRADASEAWRSEAPVMPITHVSRATNALRAEPARFAASWDRESETPAPRVVPRCNVLVEPVSRTGGLESRAVVTARCQCAFADWSVARKDNACHPPMWMAWRPVPVSDFQTVGTQIRRFARCSAAPQVHATC